MAGSRPLTGPFVDSLMASAHMPKQRGMRVSRLRALLPGAVAALLLVPSSAPAAQRWASPTSTSTSGACHAAAPCKLDHAIGGAAAGDEIIVSPGTYVVGSRLEALVPITLQGLAGSSRPRLVGTSGLSSPVLNLKAGGTLRRLAIEATSAGREALTMQGGRAEDLLLVSASGDGAKLVSAQAGTLLRDSVVRTSGTAAGTAALKLRESGDDGDVMLRNVTAVAGGQATGVRCEVEDGDVTLVNTLVRGGARDIDASKEDARCSASYSSFRAALSPGVSWGPGNQQAAPRFRDAASGDYRPAADSPTINAGTADALLGALDPAGCPRALGGIPDIGAYEFADPSHPCVAATSEPTTPPAGDGETTPEDVIRGVPAPVIGRTVVVAPGRGKVLVRRPGTTRFRRIDGAARVPVGSVVDSRDGRARLVSAVDASGRLQLGTFWGGRFKIRQRRAGNGMTTLVLRGGSFAGCPPHASDATAVASRRRRAVRRLWARDRHGRFRTHGQNSVATARGTRWLTEDRCGGTLTRVRGGAVAVRDRARRRTVRVEAGQSYFARASR
jgi:hypothetical protein